MQKLADLNARGHAREDRADPEGGDVQPAARRIQSDRAALDTFPAILDQHASSSSRRRELARAAAAARAAVGEARRQASRHDQAAVGDPGCRRRSCRARSARSCSRCGTSTRRRWRRRTAWPARSNQQKGEALAMNRKAIDYGVLERDVQSSTQIYDSLLQRAKETGVSGELKTSNIRVVDAAETAARGRSARRQALQPAARRSSAAPCSRCGLVFFFEYLDSRIKTPDEIRRTSGCRTSGMLPALDDKADGRVSAHQQRRARRTSARRSARSGPTCCSRRREEGARSLVVTSTGPGRGQDAGGEQPRRSRSRRPASACCSIDADMRKPKVHDDLRARAGARPLEPAGRQREGQRGGAQDRASPGLWVMPAGRIPPNPAELLGSQRFRDFLDVAEGALRLGHHRHAAGDGGDRRVARRAPWRPACCSSSARR